MGINQTCKKKQWIKRIVMQPCIKNRKAKNYVMKTQFIKDMVPIQQKGRQLPIQLQKGSKRIEQTDRPETLCET